MITGEYNKKKFDQIKILHTIINDKWGYNFHRIPQSEITELIKSLSNEPNSQDTNKCQK